MKQVTHDTLDDLIDFDSVFVVYEDGFIDTDIRNDFAPEVFHVEGEREPELMGRGWEFVDGFSGQHGYSGPVMHVSEFLGGGMATHVLTNPGAYVVTEVIDLDDEDGSDPVGWVLLKRTDS